MLDARESRHSKCSISGAPEGRTGGDPHGHGFRSTSKVFPARGNDFFMIRMES
jgi:hypothetical protein